MKRIIILTISLLFAVSATAADDYIENVKTFGYVSGEGLACGAERYSSYEMLVRAYLVSAARSDNEQAKGMYAYNSAKASAYLNKKKSGLYDCQEVKSRFNQQKIFSSKLYKNGKIVLPDGKVITPRQEYDVTLVYDKNENEQEKMEAFFNKIQNKKIKQAEKEGIFRKIQQVQNQHQ